jgi:hypothetical protein
MQVNYTILKNTIISDCYYNSFMLTYLCMFEFLTQAIYTMYIDWAKLQLILVILMWYLNIKQIREIRGIIKLKKLYFLAPNSII